jgi:hypothetical protein
MLLSSDDFGISSKSILRLESDSKVIDEDFNNGEDVDNVENNVDFGVEMDAVVEVVNNDVKAEVDVDVDVGVDVELDVDSKAVDDGKVNTVVDDGTEIDFFIFKLLFEPEDSVTSVLIFFFISGSNSDLIFDFRMG